MSCTAHLVLIETGSNQRFIFASNRMRENIGASELVRRVGMVWVPEAISKMFPDATFSPHGENETTAAFTRRLTEHATKDLQKKGYEIILATSGKALLLVCDAKKGKEIVWHVTLKALQEAPGLVVRGAVSEMPIDLATATKDEASSAVRNIHQALDQLKLTLPPAEARAPMLPIFQPCASSALPAEVLISGREGMTKVAASLAIAIKDGRRADAYKRMAKDFDGAVNDSYKHFDDRDLAWQAIVHADGNGFGKMFINLHKHKDDKTARDYFNTLRYFSLSLELCGVVAFKSALEAFPPRADEKTSYPIVPLVIGGDDLTVVCDGKHAINFAAHYLRAFEEATESPDLLGQANHIPLVAKAMSTDDKPVRFAAAAGIAIIKPHFPFHRGYELSESLLKSAKSVKPTLDRTDISSLDFQVVYDDGGSDLKSARTAWDIGKDSVLHARPYIVSTPERWESLSDDRKTWVNNRLFWNAEGKASLVETVKALAKVPDRDDKNSNAFPRSQQKAIRDALFMGSAIASARWEVVKRTYKFDGIVDLYMDDFKDPVDKKEPRKITQFLDALDCFDVGGELKAEPSAAGVKP